MQPLPNSENALVLRTDFSDDVVWEKICEAIQQPDPVLGFQAYVEFLDDRQYECISVNELPALLPSGPNYLFMFIVDRITVAHSEHPVLVLNLETRPAQTFRTIPSQMWAVENNLSIANMDFEEFTNAVDSDGIFRGFPIQ
ncbi:DUF6924 domain-containing protein [Leptolyngbya ohadii]|uniref:DUF6924 domain-containing protein n=1 Tax=Leptolyngbya ohadii TaxID=1962290 RepID=UPI000B59D240|nr:hypothetical protein [Leptolyngbya ohadii]